MIIYIYDTEKLYITQTLHIKYKTNLHDQKSDNDYPFESQL